MKNKIWKRGVLLLAAVITITGASSYLRADTGTCGGASIILPFTDVAASNVFFCSIAEAYFTGLTNGTTATTFSPSDPVNREQMAAFITRTLNQSLKRGNRRAALNQWAVPTALPYSAKTAVGVDPCHAASDGADIWVANFSGDSVSRVRACDGKLLETWTGATAAVNILVARGRIFVLQRTGPSGILSQLDPREPPGPVSVLATLPTSFVWGITTDGTYIWISSVNHVSKVNPDSGAVTDYSLGGDNYGILFDGTYVWVANRTYDALYKLSSNGVVLETVPVGDSPFYPIFDGMNIWVPNRSGNSITVVRAIGTSSSGAGRVLATLTGNGLNGPYCMAFDGERIAVTNYDGNSVSMWKAADLTPIGNYPGAVSPYGICSDGVNFWITFSAQDMLARF